MPGLPRVVGAAEPCRTTVLDHLISKGEEKGRAHRQRNWPGFIRFSRGFRSLFAEAARIQPETCNQGATSATRGHSIPRRQKFSLYGRFGGKAAIAEFTDPRVMIEDSRQHDALWANVQYPHRVRMFLEPRHRGIHRRCAPDARTSCCRGRSNGSPETAPLPVDRLR